MYKVKMQDKESVSDRQTDRQTDRLICGEDERDVSRLKEGKGSERKVKYRKKESERKCETGRK